MTVFLVTLIFLQCFVHPEYQKSLIHSLTIYQCSYYSNDQTFSLIAEHFLQYLHDMGQERVNWTNLMEEEPEIITGEQNIQYEKTY